MSKMSGSNDHLKIGETSSKIEKVIINMEDNPTDDHSESNDELSEVEYYLVPASSGWVLLPAASVPPNISDLPAYTNESGLPIQLSLNDQMIMVESDNISELDDASTLIHIPESNDSEENNTLPANLESSDNKSENDVESTENQIHIYDSNNILNSALMSSNISFESSNDNEDNETEVKLNLISDNQMLLLNSDLLNCDLDLPLKDDISELSTNENTSKLQLDLLSGTQIFMLESDAQLNKEDIESILNNKIITNINQEDLTSSRIEEKNNSVLKQKQLKKRRQTFKLHSDNNTITNENEILIPNYCEYCCQKFPTAASLRSHSKYIHTLNLVCKFCKLNHTELQDLLKHYNEIHETTIYECNECDDTFINESEFGKHLNNHVKDTPFPCKSNNCLQRFKTSLELKEHIKEHLLIACIKCGEKYKKDDIISMHGNYCNSCIQIPRLTNVPDRHYINPIPLQPFIDDEDLSLRIPTKTYKLYSCNYCNKKFNSEHLLQNHLHNQHEANDKYICSKCGEKLRNKSELEIHFKVHIDSKLIPDSYPCNMCNKQFIIKRTLKLHLQTVHSRNRPFVCNICDKSFQRRCIYNVHMLRHSKTSPYECDYCKKAYKIKYELQEHMQKKHIIKKSYPCIKCNEIFKTSNELYIHHKIHTDSKTYSCTICKKIFNYKQGLKLHLSTHSNDRPYNCNYCTKKFKRKFYLRNHIASCHKIEYRFPCNICDMKFKTASNRYVHSKIHKEVSTSDLMQQNSESYEIVTLE